VEEVIHKEADKENSWKDIIDGKKETKIIALHEIDAAKQERILTTDLELNRVLGGGIVPGSIVLVAGEPGIGK